MEKDTEVKNNTRRRSLKARAIDRVVHRILKAFCTIDNNELRKVPQNGPLIIVLNHINFLEVPLIYLELLPRITTGMVKKETWKNLFLGFLGNLWGAIPLDRHSTDFTAFRRALSLLDSGGILMVAPEGTRSVHGRLLKGQPGIVSLALHSGAPILPVVHFGGEKVWDNLSRVRKTRLQFRVGSPFVLRKKAPKITSKIREKMVSEIMYQIASLLPKAYRGYYAHLGGATEEYLEFVPGLTKEV